MLRTKAKSGYERLAWVFDRALEQAQAGKGLARHAQKGQAYEDQLVCHITRTEGHGFARGQALKKIDEAKRLSAARAIDELLGAMNYLAADVLVLLEEDAAHR